MSLRVLIVEKDQARAEHLSNVLEAAEYDVLPLSDFRDASEALTMQHFDAVLVPTGSNDSELRNFAAKLRAIERTSRSANATAIVGYGGGESRSAIDAVLPQDFGAKAFGAAMSKLSARVASGPQELDSLVGRAEQLIFDEAEFREQMGDDDDLMKEIIDLYLVESAKQREQMKAALAGGDLTGLSRLAHTIKGSLGSLHTPRARVRAQDLELAAKRQDGEASRPALALLEVELNAIVPVLTAFRDR